MIQNVNNCKRLCNPRTKAFLFVCLFMLLANAGRTQNKTMGLSTLVSVNEQEIPLFQVFRSIQKQTGMTFFYNNQLLDDQQKVQIRMDKQPLSKVLDQLFKGENVLYQLNGKRILLSEKPAVLEGKKHQEEVSRSPTPKTDLDTTIFIKGHVMDVDGKPISGATISKANKEGALSDDLGIFSIDASRGDELTISMIGMVTQQVIVPTNTRNFRITLIAKTNALNDVVIVGYGKQSKITVTGAVSTVNMEDMRTPVPNLENALAGKVAGILSVQSSGEPGYDNSTFTIRGIGTFQGSTAPLIIVDGVQRDDVNSSYGGSFNNIDPEDVASISLLKDASSTAMYGAKGANGVLIITTKRGVAGKPKINLKSETGLTGFTKTPQMLDGVDYMKLYNEARENMGLADFYTAETIQKTQSGLDPYLYPNVNWMDAVYKKNASFSNANMNISGGSEAVRYFASASFYDQEGPYRVKNLNNYNPNLNFKRYDFRTNLDINITKSTLLQMNLDAMLVNARYPGISAGSLWYQSYAMTPVGFPVQFPDGKWGGPVANGGTNPLNEVQNNGYSTEFKPTVQSVFTINQRLDAITKGLSAYGRFSFDSYGEFDNRRSGINDLYSATGRDDNGNLILTQTRVGQQFLGYSQGSTGDRTMYLEGNINYDRTFGSHHFGAMVLTNMRNHLVSTAGDVISSIPYRNESVAGRLAYDYMNKYLFEANAGYTGSENFEPGNKFGIFPSVSAGWVVSNEAFFKSMLKTFSLLKIRGSYGIVGNDNIGQGARFPYITQIGGGGSTGFGLNGTYAGGINESIIGVQKLTWEKSYKTDIGLEIGLFNKISITADVFQEHRKNILISRQTLSSIAGYSSALVFANIGEMNNKGFDANIEYNDKIGKVGIRLYGNVTYAHNRIVFQDEPNRKYAYQSGTGHMYGEFTGYVADGLFKDQADIDASAKQQFGVVAPGDVKYKNLNGGDDNVIDSYDWTYLGKSWFPSWLYGTGFTISYYKFDISLLFQGIADVGIMANGYGIYGNGAGANGVGVIPFSGMGQFPNNSLSIIKDRWTAADPRQNAAYPRLTIATTTDNNYLNSSRWLQDGSYLRLKQSTLGYTISSESLKKAGLASLYVYGSGENLLTFSKFKLWDPELGSNGAKYPITRMFTVGIRANF